MSVGTALVLFVLVCLLVVDTLVNSVAIASLRRQVDDLETKVQALTFLLGNFCQVVNSEGRELDDDIRPTGPVSAGRFHPQQRGREQVEDRV